MEMPISSNSELPAFLFTLFEHCILHGTENPLFLPSLFFHFHLLNLQFHALIKPFTSSSCSPFSWFLSACLQFFQVTSSCSFLVYIFEAPFSRFASLPTRSGRFKSICLPSILLALLWLDGMTGGHLSSWDRSFSLCVCFTAHLSHEI